MSELDHGVPHARLPEPGGAQPVPPPRHGHRVEVREREVVLERGHVPELEHAHDAVRRPDRPHVPSVSLIVSPFPPTVTTPLGSLGTTLFWSSNESVAGQ
jgi:hypothetical protein